MTHSCRLSACKRERGFSRASIGKEFDELDFCIAARFSLVRLKIQSGVGRLKIDIFEG